MNTKSTTIISPQAFPLIGRILLAAIFLISGFGKLITPGATIAYISTTGLPSPLLSYIGSMAFELVASTLLIVGYRARLIAALLAAYAIVTAFVFHHALCDQNQMFHFLKNFAMAGGLLQVVAFGAGAYSFDDHHKTAVTVAT